MSCTKFGISAVLHYVPSLTRGQDRRRLGFAKPVGKKSHCRRDFFAYWLATPLGLHYVPSLTRGQDRRRLGFAKPVGKKSHCRRDFFAYWLATPLGLHYLCRLNCM